MSHGEEEYKVQQRKLMDALERKDQVLDIRYSRNVQAEGDMQSRSLREEKYDRNTRIYERILENDFRQQLWISKSLKERKTRDNIDRNYMLVTGKGSLGSKELKARKEAFDRKRMLSSRASEQVANVIYSGFEVKYGIDELASFVRALEIKDFSFENDEDLVLKFSGQMPKLIKAEALLKKLDAGEKDELREDAGLYRKLLYLQDIKSAYEERMIMISSPYYVSLNDEDYTEETLKHMEKSWREGGDLPPEYVDAVISWHTRMKDAHAFKKGVKDVDEEGVDKLARTHQQTRELLEEQDAASSYIARFDDRVKKEAAESGFKHDVSIYSLKEIQEYMDNDKKSKSVSYMKMERALKDIFRMRQGVSEYGTVKVTNDIADYRDIIRHAETVALEYAASHTKWFHFTESGSERLKMSMRLAELLGQLRRDMNKVIEEKEARPETERSREAAADIEKIINTGAFSAKEAGKEIKDWLLDNPDYKAVLLRIVRGKEELQGDKETLLKFLEDKNRLLMANNVTLSMICDEHPELTFRLPALKKELKEYVENKLMEKPETQEKIFSDVKEFRQFISDSLEGYRQENDGRLTLIEGRKDILVQGLNADETDESFWQRKEVEELLLNTDDLTGEVLLARIEELKINKTGNEQIIERIVEETGWSEVSKKSLSKKIKEKLGSLLFFGGELDVAETAGRLITASDYVCPVEAEAERRLNSAMFMCQVPDMFRNSLADYLSAKKGAAGIADMDYNLMIEATQIFMDKVSYCERLIINSGLANKKLTSAQWKDIDKLRYNAGRMEHMKDISRGLFSIVSRDVSGLKMSHDAYKKQKVKAPKKSVGFMEGIFGDRFLGDDEVKGVLEEDEIAYLKENLVKQFATDDDTFVFLERATGSEISSIAAVMKKNLGLNIEKFRTLRNDKDIDETVKRKVLLRTVCASKDAKEDIFESILREEKEEFEKKAALEKEMSDVKELVEEGIPKDVLTTLKASTYKKRLNYLRSYDRGKYAILAPFLLEQPEFYTRVMNFTRKEFIDFVRNEVENKYGVIAEALKASTVGDAVKRKYLEAKFKDIQSGKLSGKAVSFRMDIDAYEKRLLNLKERGKRSIWQNQDDIIKELNKDQKGSKDEIKQKYAIILGVTGLVVQNLLNDSKRFDVLKSKDEFKAEVEKALRLYYANAAYAEEQLKARFDEDDCPFHEEEANSKLIIKNQFGKFLRDRFIENEPDKFKALFPKFLEEFERKQTKVTADYNAMKLPANYDEVRQEVEDRKDSKKALKARRKIMGFDDHTETILSESYVKKSLVNIGTGHETDLSHKSWAVARDHISERLSYLGNRLSPMIIDCLVEKNVTTWYDEAIDRTPGLHKLVRTFINNGFKELDENAKWLGEVSEILKDTDKDEEPMSEEELNMMIVNIYRNEKRFLKKDGTGEHDGSRKTVKGKWYRDFRQNYKDLKTLEAMKITDPGLRQEQLGLSRDLRALLSVGLGHKGQDKKAKLEFKALVSRGRSYLGRIQGFCDLTLERLNAHDSFKALGDEEKKAYVQSLREYFNTELTDELKDDIAGVQLETPLNRDSWQTKIDTVLSDPLKMRYMIHSEKTVGSESLNKKDRNFTGVVGRGAIDSIIEKYGWPGQRRKYGNLSDEGKQFFALALMLMEKSSIGLENGSAKVLSCKELADEQAGKKLLEIKKFLQGEPYDLKVDYQTACFKLVNYGYDFDNEGLMKLSDTAYDKALEFAEGIINRRYSLDAKGLEKAGDPTEIIIEAGLLGKDQALEMSKLSDEQWSVSKFRTKLMEYAAKDADKITEKIGAGKYVPFKEAQAKKEQERIEKVTERLSKLGRLELLKLVGVLQNRTAIDASTRDKEKVLNEEKREELKLMLSDEEESAATGEFTSPGACLTAILSCISFKVKDEKTSGKSMYEKGDFDNVSFDREGMVDWELLDRAIDLLDEAKKDNIARYAVRHASDYIERSGNEKAIAEYKNFAGQKTMDEDQISLFLKEQAEKDAASGDYAQARIAYGGFEALTPAQKKLFFRVLGHRDLLDISKRNLYRNIFKGSAERNYANEVGRFRLIDEYIEKSAGGNEGITLSDTAHYDAFKSLLSTQIDDTADFGSITDVRDALAGESMYLFQRNTAVDWKLFTRALQFVNRASYELEMREGNAELYRAAGDLSKHGHMSMDYSILRKNIHNTGNQFVRFGVQRGLEFAGPNLLKTMKLNIFGFEVEVGSIADFVTDAAALIMPENVAGAIKEVKDVLILGKTERQTRGDLKTFEFKPKQEGEKLEKNRKKVMDAAYNDMDKMSAQVNSVFENLKLMEKNASDIGTFIARMIPGPQQMTSTVGKPKEKKKKDLLESQIEGYKSEKRYGDIRDTFSAVKKRYDQVDKVYGVAKKAPYVGKKVEDYIKLAESKVIESFAEYAAGKETSAWVKKALDESLALVKEKKLDNLKKTTLEKLIKENKVAKDYKFTEEDIKTHKYWKPEAEELTGTERMKAADNAAKTYLSGIVEGIVGKDNAEAVYNAIVDAKKFTDMFREKMVLAGAVINTAKVFAESFVDIAQRAENVGLINDAEERAEKDEVKERDRKKIEDAKAFQTEDQKALLARTVEQHLDLEKMADTVSKTIQGIEISRDIAKIVIQTGTVAANLAGADPATTKLVSEAIKAGVDFALYVVRCVKDQNMLADYFRNTSQGKASVKGILDGAEHAFGKEKVDDTAMVKDDKVLDIICAGKGYEKREELVTDTGLKMAASIAFSASDYNPILANKIRAVTCMVVLGMRDKVGKTDAGTIQSIFGAMKAA